MNASVRLYISLSFCHINRTRVGRGVTDWPHGPEPAQMPRLPTLTTQLSIPTTRHIFAPHFARRRPRVHSRLRQNAASKSNNSRFRCNLSKYLLSIVLG